MIPTATTTVFDDGETIEDYVLRLNSMAAHLTTLGENVKDSEIIVKMLRSLHRSISNRS